MKTKIAFLLALTLAFFSANAPAASATTTNVSVELISAIVAKDYVLVQTFPRPNISTVSCTNDYWLVLHSTLDNYDEIYTQLMMAQANGKKIDVSIDDSNIDPTFCRLTRVTLRSN